MTIHHGQPFPQPARRPARVRILLNTNPDAQLIGYTLHDTVTGAYEYDDAELDPRRPGPELAERVLNLVATGHLPISGRDVDPRAREYRNQGHRAIAVGDVVCVDGHYYACEPLGWCEIDPPHETAHDLAGPTDPD